MITKDQIAAALRKLGPSTPAALATELDATRNTLQYHLKAMLADKAVHAAGNRLNRVVALPDQKIEGAPPQSRKPPRRKKKSNGTAKKTKRAPRAARTSTPEAVFIPAIDAECRLVCINGGAAPTVYSEAQTQRIATLLLKHFEA
jgi:hypothetical protein